MRISDWSSDVCSSDLVGDRLGLRQIESAIEKCALGEFAGARGPRTSSAGRPHQQLECHRAAVRLQLDDVFAGKRMWRGEVQHESAVDCCAGRSAEIAQRGDTRCRQSTGNAFTNDRRSGTGNNHNTDATASSEEHTSELQSLMRTSYAVF